MVVDGKKTAVFCLYKDSHGIMWLGTNSGLFFFDGVSTHPVGETELFGLQIYSVLEDDNKLYLGSNNGLLIYDYTVGKVEFCNVPTQKEIRTLLLFDSHLWIGGLNGLGRLDIKIIATPIARKVYPISRCIHYFATAEESFTPAHSTGLLAGRHRLNLSVR